MKVILLQDVKKQGKKDQVIEVSDGYANNFLIKNKLAIAYTKGSSKVLNKQLENKQEIEDKLIKEYNQIKEKLKTKKITFKVKTGKNDQVFGTISTKQIHEELNKMGYNIDKKKIKIDHHIDSLGSHIVKLELHKKVTIDLTVELVK